MAPILKEDWEIKLIREAGVVVSQALEYARKMVRPGVTTGQIDQVVDNFIRSKGCYPTFKGYRDFPASACISINEEVVHGIPSNKRVLREGDIVSLDVAATYKNYIADAAVTLPVGKVSQKAQDLIDTARTALDKAIEAAKPYGHLKDISRSIQNYAESKGYSVVKKYVGHGVGRQLHEDPQIPNYVVDQAGFDTILQPGLVIAIEPMVNEGTSDVVVLENNWTVVTEDRKLSAHFEHTIAITESGVQILTFD